MFTWFWQFQGHPRLVKALGDLYGRLVNRAINPFTEVIVTGGAYGALFCTIMSTIGPGDEVMITMNNYGICYGSRFIHILHNFILGYHY